MGLFNKGVLASLKVLFIALLAVPLAFSCNILFRIFAENNLPIAILIPIVSSVLIAIVATLLHLIFHGTSKDIKDPAFYVFALFSFICIIAGLLALEYDGFISGFMSEYLKHGEPYISSPFGAIDNYYEAIFCLPIYLIICTSIGNRKSYRNLGIFWSAIMVNTFGVFILSVVCGKLGVYPATMLNLPCLILPIAIGWTCLQEKYNIKLSNSYKLYPLYKRHLDLILVILLSLLTVIVVLRGLAALGSPLWIVAEYGKIEPQIVNPDVTTPFTRIQTILYLFYCLPLLCFSVPGLIKSGCTWMTDVALLLAGAFVQGQITYIGSLLHPRSRTLDYLKDNITLAYVFWTINAALFFVPLVLLLRVTCFPDFFHRQNQQYALPEKKNAKVNQKQNQSKKHK